MKNLKYTGNLKTKRIRKIARIWATVIIVYTLLLLIGYTCNWLTTGKADAHAVEDAHSPFYFWGSSDYPLPGDGRDGEVRLQSFSV